MAPDGNASIGDDRLKKMSEDRQGEGSDSLGELFKAPVFADPLQERASRKERLVAGIRIFAKYGFDHHVAGHLSVKDPVDEKTYWVNPLGLAFALVTVSDLIQVNRDGHVISGGKPGRRIANAAGVVIHSHIHDSREDAVAICHSHSIYGKAFSTLGKNIDFTTQDSCVFYNDIALYTDFGGAVFEIDEGAKIAQALNDKKAVILQNHGILTVGPNVECAVAWFILLEAQCQVQLLADAAGKTQKIGEKEADYTFKTTGNPLVGYGMASPYFQVIEKEQGHEYKQ